MPKAPQKPNKKKKHKVKTEHYKRARRIPAILWVWESEKEGDEYVLNAVAKVGGLYRQMNQPQLATVIHMPMYWTLFFRAIYHCPDSGETWIETEMADVRQLQVLGNLEPIAQKLKKGVLEAVFKEGLGNAIVDLGWIAISRINENHEVSENLDQKWLGTGIRMKVNAETKIPEPEIDKDALLKRREKWLASLSESERNEIKDHSKSAA
jgi:hypothetical protein